MDEKKTLTILYSHPHTHTHIMTRNSCDRIKESKNRKKKERNVFHTYTHTIVTFDSQ